MNPLTIEEAKARLVDLAQTVVDLPNATDQAGVLVDLHARNALTQKAQDILNGLTAAANSADEQLPPS